MLVPTSETISKGEFAALIRRDPGRVSQLIGEGKIHGPALVGAGRTARVNWRVALQQLGTSLDLGQQLAQVNPIGFGLSPAEDEVPASSSAAGARAVPINDDQKALLAAKREQAVAEVRQAAHDFAAHTRTVMMERIFELAPRLAGAKTQAELTAILDEDARRILQGIAARLEAVTETGASGSDA